MGMLAHGNTFVNDFLYTQITHFLLLRYQIKAITTIKVSFSQVVSYPASLKAIDKSSRVVLSCQYILIYEMPFRFT
jgi:hypothetical protein